MTEYYAGSVEALKNSGRLVLRCGDAEIGVFLIDSDFYAWHNECAHRGGPVCQGRIFNRVIEPIDNDGTVRTLEYHAQEIHIVCPWHGYEFNLKTGQHPGHPGLKLRKAKVSVRDGGIYVLPG
jgi:nitrite reductase (NADH) small subunit